MSFSTTFISEHVCFTHLREGEGVCVCVCGVGGWFGRGAWTASSSALIRSFKFVGEGRVQRLFYIQELALGAFD